MVLMGLGGIPDGRRDVVWFILIDGFHPVADYDATIGPHGGDGITSIPTVCIVAKRDGIAPRVPHIVAIARK